MKLMFFFTPGLAFPKKNGEWVESLARLVTRSTPRPLEEGGQANDPGG